MREDSFEYRNEMFGLILLKDHFDFLAKNRPEEQEWKQRD